MEKPSDQRTRDFMNVESFSQLPLMRSEQPSRDKPIRLFGIEFAGGGGTKDEPCESSDLKDGVGLEDSGKNSNSGSNRRFECHYCCRIFPTSQALGGHQNAHKRERQHAKRNHLHPAIPNPHHPDHLLGFCPSSWNHPSWTTSTNYISHGTSYFGSHCSSRAISSQMSGSPLGLWRLPPSSLQPAHFPNSDRLSSLHHRSSIPMIANDPVPTGSTSRISPYTYDKSKSSTKDHVSLDLHL